MIASKPSFVTKAVGVAAILCLSTWAAAAGPAAGGGGGGGEHSSGGGAVATPAAAPAGGGGAAPVHSAAPAAAPSSPAPSAHSQPAVGVAQPAPANVGQIGQAHGAPNPAAAPVGNQNGFNQNGYSNDGRPAWRHHHRDGSYSYGDDGYYGGVPYYNNYVNAGPDGYYNGAYGYNGDQDDYQQAPVIEPNSTAAPAPQPAPVQPAGPSAASIAAQQKNSVDNNPQVIAAEAAVRRAQQAYDVERKRVLAALAKNPEYQQAMAKRGAAQEKVNAARSGDAVPDPSAMAPAADEKMQAGDEVTSLRQKAVEADPAAKAAEIRLSEAVQRRDEVRAEVAKKYQP